MNSPRTRDLAYQDILARVSTVVRISDEPSFRVGYAVALGLPMADHPYIERDIYGTRGADETLLGRGCDTCRTAVERDDDELGGRLDGLYELPRERHPITPSAASAPAPVPPSAEILAVAVHDAWRAAKQAEGYADHPVVASSATLIWTCRRCDIPYAMHDRNMIPFADFPEATRDYSIRQAQAILDQLGLAGVAWSLSPAAPSPS